MLKQNKIMELLEFYKQRIDAIERKMAEQESKIEELEAKLEVKQLNMNYENK